MRAAFRAGPDRILNPFLEPVLLDAVTTSQSSPVQIDTHQPPLSAPLKLSFDYTRSVGPTLSQFFTALRERRIVGVRGSDGRVYVPPAEFDPVTYERLTEIVPEASVGTLLSWTWQPEPLEGQPLDRPFAWALIKLDGADVPLLHAVDAGSSDAIGTGGWTHHFPLLGAWRRSRAGVRRDRRPRTGDGPGDPEQHRNPAHRFASRDRVPARAGGGQAAGRPHGQGRQSVLPAQGSRPGHRPGTRQFHRVARQGNGDDVRDHQHPVRRPADQAAVRRGLRAARRRRYRVLASDSRDRRDRGADGHAGRGRLEGPRRVGPGHRQHRILQADRRTRRRLRHLQTPPVKGTT